LSQSQLTNRQRIFARLATLATLLALATSCALGGLAALASPAGAARTLYVANFFLGAVSAYSIGPGGGLSPVAGSPLITGVAPFGVAMSPDGKYLYVTDGEANTVSVFSIASDGSIDPIPQSPFATGNTPWGVAVSPDGEHLYVANNGTNKVSAYSIASNGSLSAVPGSPVPTGGKNPNGIALTPDGKHLYVSNLNSRNVSAFSIASDGSLSPVAGSPFLSGSTARPAVVSPDGKYLYVGTADEDIWVYSIGADGALTPIAGSPFYTEGQSLGLGMTPDGAHLYGAHVGWGDNVWGYSIGSDGALSPLSGSPFPTGSWRGHSVAVTPDSKFLYSSSTGFHHISAYSIAANGNLSMIGSPVSTGNGPMQLVVTPDQGPVAAFSATPTPAGNPLSLDASASSDPDGSVASYHWDFGDGQTQVALSAKVAHVYASPGDYTVTLTVTDNSGCSATQTFTGQTVSCNGSPLAQVSHEVTVPPGESLGVSLAGSGSGSVTSSPSGIGCPSGTCSYSFEPGTPVTLTAEPAAGSRFAGWSGGGCEGTGTCEVTLDDATEVTATFEEIPPPPRHALTVQLAGDGVGSVEDGTGGISCPFVCSRSYVAGTQVTLIPKPTTGATFAGWSGGGCMGTGGCQLTIGADTTVIASFEKVPATAVPAGLRIGHVRGVPKLIVRGGIVKAASGAVRVKISAQVQGRRVSVAKWAKIRDGRWRTRLPFSGPKGKAISVTVRFAGSPGVEGGFAKRRVRVLSPT